MTTMQDTLNQTKAEFLRAKERLCHTLATTPDERINWSPSPTARTPIQQVAHCAQSISGIQGMLAGKPFPYAGIAEFDPPCDPPKRSSRPANRFSAFWNRPARNTSRGSTR